MRPKAFLLIVFVLPLWLSGQDLQFGIPFRLDVGSCYARVDGDIHKEVSQLPGVAINISSGIQATYRERVGLRVEMGYFLNTYRYSFLRGANYEISQFDPQVSAQLFAFSNPINQHGSRLFFGISGGYSFFSGDVKFSEQFQYSVLTRSNDRSSLFLSPEIGLLQIKNDKHFNLSVCYTAHLNDVAGLTSFFELPLGEAQANSRNNSLSLRFRYTIPLKSGKRSPNPFITIPSHHRKDFSSRNTRDAARLSTRSKNVHVIIEDIAEEDQDSIAISVNGNYILFGHEISRDRKKLKIQLEAGSNDIVFYALNEGRISPNTAKCTLRLGWFRKKTIHLTTSKKINQQILIERLGNK